MATMTQNLAILRDVAATMETVAERLNQLDGDAELPAETEDAITDLHRISRHLRHYR